MFKGLGGLGDMAKVMKQAQEMQGKVSEVQERLNNILVSGESGAGLVKVTMTAKGDITNLDIDSSIFSPTEKEVVEDYAVGKFLTFLKNGRFRVEPFNYQLGMPGRGVIKVQVGSGILICICVEQFGA